MAKQQKVKIKIPKGYTARERTAISQEMIAFIIRRTQNGRDKNGTPFKGYTKEYKESFEFRVAGKSSRVNLTLTEEMLGELKEVDSKDGEIDLGYDGRRAALNGKVEGNRKGTYGQRFKRIAKRTPRDFLGISESAKNRILAKYPLNNDLKRLTRLALVETATEKVDDLVADAELFQEELDG